MGKGSNSSFNSNSGNRNKGQSGYSRTGSNYNSGLPDQKTQNAEIANTLTQATLDAYEEMYGKLKGMHDAYLHNGDDSVEKSEDKTYENLTKADGTILKKFDSLYEALTKKHDSYMEHIRKDFENLGVSSNGANAANSNTAANVAGDVALLATLNKFDKTLDKLVEVITEGGLGRGKSDSGDPTVAKKMRYYSGDATFSRALDKLTDNMVTIARDVNSSLVASKEATWYFNVLTQGFDKTTDLISAFMAQEKVGDNLIGIVVWSLSTILDFLGAGVQEQYNTREELFSKFQAFNNDNLSYNEVRDNIRDKLLEQGLDDNIKSTEVMKQLVELQQSGFSTQQAQEAAIQNSILKVIAPALNTNSEIFKDFQQRNMVEIVQSLGGLVQTVRENAGSSRITVKSLDTLISKLGPVELYAKKGLLGEDATRALSALEKSGMATEDAIAFVSEAADVISNPYKAVTGGNIAQRIAAARGEYGSLSEVIGSMLDTYATFTQTTTGMPLTEGAVMSALGSGMSVYGDYVGIRNAYQTEFDRLTTLAEATESGEEQTPVDEYLVMLEALKDNTYQTGVEMAGIAKNNAEFSTGVANWLADIDMYLMEITEYVLGIANTMTGFSQSDIDQKIAIKKQDKAQEQLAKLATKAQQEGGMSDEDRKTYKTAVSEYEAATKELLAERDAEVTRGQWTTQIIGGVLDVATGAVALGGLADLLYESGLINKTTRDYASYGNYARRRSSEYVADYKNLESTELANVAAYKALIPNAEGGYYTSATPILVGEAGSEIVAPEPKLLENVIKGVTIANNNAELVAAIREATVQVVNAIIQNGGGIMYNPETGLMSVSSNSTNTSLKAVMK